MDASTRYRFGPSVVDLGRRQVLVDGQPAKVGARAFDLLVALIERRSRVVSKEELLDLVWRDVAVEEGNLQVQIAALRKIIGADAIVTSAGRGYQFAAQLEDVPAQPAPPESPQPAVVQDSPLRAPWFTWRRIGSAAAALVGVVVLAAGAAIMLAPRPLPPGSTTLAAMPFVDVSGDQTSNEFARGLTSDIGVDFSRFHDLNVIAASVTASYARESDVRRVAKDLRVQYVLTGAVQRQGDAIQASAELIDGATGESVWSNRRQGSVTGDLLAFQADVADSIASTLGSRNFFVMRAIGAARAKRPEDRTPYDFFALGYAAYLKGTAEGFAESKRDFDEAIAKNPRLTLAMVQRGWASWLYVDVAGGDWTAALNETERFARQAIDVDPLDAEAHIQLADKLGAFGKFAEARAEVERGLKLNPSSADILMKAALVMPALGEPERGAALCDRAFHLNSMPVIWYAVHCIESYFFMGRYADSLDMVRRTHAWIPQDWWDVMYELADETELDDKEAAATLARFKRDYPGLSLEGLGYAGVFIRPQELDRLVATMSKAGVPICVSPDKANELPKPLHIAQCDAERARQAAR